MFVSDDADPFAKDVQITTLLVEVHDQMYAIDEYKPPVQYGSQFAQQYTTCYKMDSCAIVLYT